MVLKLKKPKPKKEAVIADLTTGRRSDKRYIGTLERRSAKYLEDCTRMEAELNACRRECGELYNKELKHDLLISDLRLQIYNFQKLVYYTAQVTTWKENDDG